MKQTTPTPKSLRVKISSLNSEIKRAAQAFNAKTFIAEISISGISHKTSQPFKSTIVVTHNDPDARKFLNNYADSLIAERNNLLHELETNFPSVSEDRIA